jgi:hypothetical protein
VRISLLEAKEGEPRREIQEARRRLSEKVRKNAKIGLSELQFFVK